MKNLWGLIGWIILVSSFLAIIPAYAQTQIGEAVTGMSDLFCSGSLEKILLA